MRSPIVLAVALALGAVACSSSSVTQGAPDAAAAAQSPGGPCDPSAAVPCFPSGDPCVSVACDPVLRICRQSDLSDGGPLCNASGAPCTKATDCATGLSCGFPAAGGCGVAGVCIDVPIACDNDAASCVTAAPACGCDGRPDPFVIAGYAAAPVASAGPCGADGGTAQEAGAAGGSDASGE